MQTVRLEIPIDSVFNVTAMYKASWSKTREGSVQWSCFPRSLMLQLA